MLIARVSSNKNGVGDVLEGLLRPFVVWSKKKKRKGHGPTLVETRPDHAIRSSVAITKLPLGRDIRKNLKKEKCDFLKIFFLWIF